MKITQPGTADYITNSLVDVQLNNTVLEKFHSTLLIVNYYEFECTYIYICTQLKKCILSIISIYCIVNKSVINYW